MKLVIDNNIVFSIMKPDSASSFLFYKLLEQGYEFFAPLDLVEEFDNHEDECFTKSKISIDNFKLRKKEVFSKINLIELSYYKEEIHKIINSLSDKDDVSYMALALKFSCPLWSND
ncbi:MAG: PIN domain-containing protein, partial [Nanoarchaeota archaeon]